MSEFNFSNIHLHITDLQVFLCVAKYGSFTKAGEKLFITQSWVSKRISLMESELDIILFDRNRREVTLTPAGRELRQRLEGIPENIYGAFKAAQLARTGEAGTLCIGFLEWGTMVFLKELEAFTQSRPDINVEVYRQTFDVLRTGIATNRMDMIFTISYDCDQLSPDEYNMLHIQQIPLMAYMCKSNPLSAKKTIEIDDLCEQPILMVDNKFSPGYSNYIRQLFLRNNIRPNIVQQAHDGGAHIGNILINKGILLASKYFLENSWNDSIARPIVAGVNINVTAIWKKQSKNPMLSELLHFITGADASNIIA